MSPKPLSVAIVGGGIGGVCTAIALLKYPHIDVQVYEAASSFGEIGAGVSIGPNAQKALELIAPEARAAFDKHATGNMSPRHAKTMINYVVVSRSLSVGIHADSTKLQWHSRAKVSMRASSFILSLVQPASRPCIGRTF